MPSKTANKTANSKIDERLRWMYTQMVRIREFEEAVKRTFIEHPGVIRGHAHLGDGAEASIVGALSTRHESDMVMPSYRCHGYPIVLGTSLRKMMAEVFGRKHGLCQGFGGSMHLADPSRYFPGTSGIIGQSIAHATGAALTAQVKKKGHIVYCFFGDGAAKQGAFFESLNMAAVWKLPIVYVLENNQYQAYTHFSLEDANAIAGDPLSKKADAFSIPGTTVDGTDPVAVGKVVAKAADRARAGKGPSLVETKFYRHPGASRTLFSRVNIFDGAVAERQCNYALGFCSQLRIQRHLSLGHRDLSRSKIIHTTTVRTSIVSVFNDRSWNTSLSYRP